MPKFRIQLHPEAAPFLVTSKEAAEKVINLYRRLTKYGITAAPYFTFPLVEDMVKRYPKQYGAILCTSFSRGSRESEEEALTTAIMCLRDREAGIYKGLYSPIFGFESEAEKEAYQAAKVEALEVLSLISPLGDSKE